MTQNIISLNITDARGAGGHAMRTAVLVVLLAWPVLGWGKVLNVEFNFAPYTGDTKADEVQTVPGTATVYVNGIMVASQVIKQDTVPVLFDEREIAASVWVPTQSLGSLLRKGKNRIRVEFAPSVATPYKAQLRWAQVTDQVQEEDTPGGSRSTNQANEGVETKDAKGKLTMEREFDADFATAQPWHAYPAVTTLTGDDKQKVLALAVERAGWFAPDFAGIYTALAGNEGIEVAQVRAAKCLDAVYAAGVRIGPPKAGTYDITTTGSAAVVVQSKGEMLYDIDRAAFDKVTDEDVQMCAGMVLGTIYQRLIAVRTPDGTWQGVP